MNDGKHNEEFWAHFHPDHSTDLQKSGLLPSTVREAGIFSARPGDISRLVGWDPQGVTSALVIPYPGAGDFARVKVFPPYTTQDGDTAKYLQRPDSGVRLYIPPRVTAILKDTHTPLFWTEGEKKSLKATQEGLPCIGLGGLWNFLRGGKPLPEMEVIAYADRQMILVPDSDVWARPDLLQPVFALGKILEEHGSIVSIVILPHGPQGEKQGLDDFLVRDGVNGYASLKRIPLRHKAFSAARKWWKSWSRGAEAKQGTRQTIQSGSFPLTDYGNAQRLSSEHHASLRYCYDWGQWFVWDGKRWAIDRRGEVERLAKRTVRGIYREAARAKTQEDREAIAAWAVKSEGHRAIQSMISLARSEPNIPILPEELDRDPWLLNVANGTLDLRTSTLRPYQREDLITKLAPVHYDPMARSIVWEHFLLKVLPNERVRHFIKKASGYSLTGDGSEESLFFPFGPTKTGKSTFLKALRSTMGDYATTADFETFLARDRVTGGPRQDIAELAGYRLVVSLEVDQGKRLAEGLIKWLFGGDFVKARFLYKREFEFLPTFKLWLAANHHPQASPDDDAVWERIRQIPFDQSIPRGDRDPSIKATLSDPEQSGSAILAWMVEGCRLWQQEGLKPPEEIDRATKTYRDEMDPLPEFLKACTTREAGGRVVNAALWDAYQGWAWKNPDMPRLGRKAFSQRLEAQDIDSSESGGYRYWLGMRLSYANTLDE